MMGFFLEKVNGIILLIVCANFSLKISFTFFFVIIFF